MLVELKSLPTILHVLLIVMTKKNAIIISWVACDGLTFFPEDQRWLSQAQQTKQHRKQIKPKETIPLLSSYMLWLWPSEFLKCFFFSFTWVIFYSNSFFKLICSKEVLPLNWLLHCCSLAATLPRWFVFSTSGMQIMTRGSAGCWHYLVCSPHVLPYLIVPTQTGICLNSRSVDTS